MSKLWQERIRIRFHTLFIICVLLFNDITIHNLKFKMYIVCGNLSINKPLWTELNWTEITENIEFGITELTL